MAKKVLNLLMDVDGCLFHYFHPLLNCSQRLITGNQDLLEKIIQEILAEGYDKVIVSLGSNRQDQRIDLANPGGSCVTVLPLLQSYLALKLGGFCEVVLDPFLMADLYSYHNPKAGTSYHAILRQQFRGAPHQSHNKSVLDESKISLIYAFDQRVAVLHPEAEQIVISFFDDNHRILSSLTEFYTANPSALASNTMLRLNCYRGLVAKKPFCEIQGTGCLDSHYEWSVRYMYNRTYKCEDAAHQGRQITTADALQTAHTEDHYSRSGRTYVMEVPRKYDPLSSNSFHFGSFQTFHSEEIQKLPTNPSLSRENVYTTALELYQRQLLPGRYVLNHQLPPGILMDISKERLEDLKHQIAEIFGQYISCWKFSFFGHHHNDRARVVNEALQGVRTITDMEEILLNQQSLFPTIETPEVAASSSCPPAVAFENQAETGFLEPRWSQAEYVVHQSQPGKLSGYASALKSALAVVYDFKQSEACNPSTIPGVLAS
jgi:hypothetical protein